MKKFIIILIMSFTTLSFAQESTGIWEVDYFVDDFGEQTDVGFITNTVSAKGLFSNSAVHNALLYACFIIKSSEEIYIQLYEYGGTNPVKSFSSNYSLLVQDNDGNRAEFNTANYSDRLKASQIIGTYIDETTGAPILEFTYGTDVEWIHKALMKGGTVKFRIKGDTSTYKIDIQNADGYAEAYKILTKRG